MRITRLKTTILACAFLATLFLGMGTSVFAGEPIAPPINYTPLAPLPETGPCTGTELHCLPEKVLTLGGYLRGVYILGVILAGLFAVFSIVRGGFQLLWTDSILGHSEGKAIILRALGGLLIVYSSYILMNVINPQLGRDLNLELKLPQITTQRGLFGQLLSTATDSANTALTREQLAMFNEAEKRNDEWRAKEITRLKGVEIPNLQRQLDAATTDEERATIGGLLQKYRDDLNELELEGVTLKTERQIYRNALNPDNTETDMKALVDKAVKSGDGDFANIHNKYEEKRTAYANDPVKVAEYHLQEMNTIGSANKSLAVGIIERPPTKVVTTTNSETGQTYTATLRDDTTLNSQVGARITAINQERIDRMNALDALAAQNPTLADGINAKKQSVWNESCKEIRWVNDACKNKRYSCGTKAGEVIPNQCSVHAQITI